MYHPEAISNDAWDILVLCIQYVMSGDVCSYTVFVSRVGFHLELSPVVYAILGFTLVYLELL